MAGGADSYTHCSGRGDHDLYLCEEQHKEDGYLTYVFSGRAIDYV